MGPNAAETGITEFVGENGALVEASLPRPTDSKQIDKYFLVRAPTSLAFLDFNPAGPFNIYALELFFYVPMMISQKYRQIGQYEQAMSWLRAIYDPSKLVSGMDSDEQECEVVWNVKPLRFPISYPIIDSIDPDKVARADPIEYRNAVVRTYNETLIDYGDRNYRLETEESLRFAKSIYASANALFLQ